nr:HAMP domain-containing sensor histidine kinase [Hymenobacter lucidus]
MANQEAQARNEQLDSANQHLARTNTDLDNFVYAASHDLRQPVDNLRGLFDELRRSATITDPDAGQLWQLVDSSLSVLLTTITDLATVVQVERSPGVEPTEPVALADVVADVLQTLQPQLQAVNADVQLDLAALPTLITVKSNLRTILLNLLGNAVKYHHSQRRPCIQLKSRVAQGQAVLEVRDNGLGMDLERYGKELFQLFRRFHPQAGTGTGVGLFLVNRLVQSQGGHIEVESQPEAGTMFRIHFGPGSAGA